jgi:acylglycerol lipase
LEKLTAQDVGDAKALVPMWFGHGDADRVTSWAATKKLADVLGVKGDVSFVTYEGGYHRVHMDPGEVRERFVKDVADWILKKSPAAEVAAE